MPRPFLLLAAGALALHAPLPASAESDPAARQLIEQLRPATRGIRLPAPAEAPPVTPPPVAPAALPTPSAPMPPAGPAPAAMPAPAPAQPDPKAPAAASMPAATTAPAGVPAVSITVTFPSGSAALTPAAEATLAPLGRALASPDLAPYRFRIEGHTDSVGDAALNQRLSERRAQAVRGYLINKHGVAPQRLEAIGLGESRPLVPSGDGVDEPRNRRVQVLNLDG